MYSNLPLYKFTYNYIAIPIVWYIIYAITSTFTTHIYLNNNALSSFVYTKKIICFLFYFCSLMTVICHTMSMYQDPGTLDYKQVSKLSKKQKNFCKKCNKDRPMRTHHCSICGRCIMKMDHHCPWIFNCVGFGNQKTFILFLFYSFSGCGIAFVTLLPRFFTDDFVYMLKHPKFKINFNTKFIFILIQVFASLSEPFLLFMGTVLAFVMSLSIGCIFFSQIYNMVLNTTGIEHLINENDIEKNEWYAYKDRWFMVKTVMGLNDKWKWFFPIFERNKYNNGYTFDTPYDRNNKTEKVKKVCCNWCGC